jgi:vancomycin aglycone glucosyltransferase
VLARNPIRVLREGYEYVSQSLAERVRALTDAADGADLVVAGGAEMAASSAAERHGIAYRYVVYCPVLLPSREHPPPFLNRDGRVGWLNRALWPITLAPVEIAIGRALSRARAEIGLGPVRWPYRMLLGDRPLLAADRVLATAPGDARVAVEQIAALHPLDGDPLPPKLGAFLDAGEAPVYVGFGSMPDADPVATTRVVLAAVEQLGVRAILSAGWAKLGGVALPEGVIEIGPVAHPRLFPRCAAIVHHGGAGTTTTALRAGAPQVVVPHLADQFYWGRRVRDLGIGVATRRKHGIGVAELVAAVGAVLENETLAERSRELGERARTEARATNPLHTLLR